MRSLRRGVSSATTQVKVSSPEITIVARGQVLSYLFFGRKRYVILLKWVLMFSPAVKQWSSGINDRTGQYIISATFFKLHKPAG